MTTTPAVVSIQLHHAEGRLLRPVPAARALVQKGLEGDSHSRYRPGHRRQVVVLDESTLSDFGLQPGDLREQITIRGIPDITRTPRGTRLEIGEAILESAGECEPCTTIGAYVGVPDPKAFQAALKHRRGLLCRVVEVRGEGWVRVGDTVKVLEPAL